MQNPIEKLTQNKDKYKNISLSSNTCIHWFKNPEVGFLIRYTLDIGEIVRLFVRKKIGKKWDLVEKRLERNFSAIGYQIVDRGVALTCLDPRYIRSQCELQWSSNWPVRSTKWSRLVHSLSLFSPSTPTTFPQLFTYLKPLFTSFFAQFYCASCAFHRENQFKKRYIYLLFPLTLRTAPWMTFATCSSHSNQCCHVHCISLSSTSHSWLLSGVSVHPHHTQSSGFCPRTRKLCRNAL